MGKILIAEDSATVAAVMTRALAPLGHTILIARDGAEAQRHIRADRPDLVILDVIMPRMNGFELCRIIRANPILKETPIFVVTSMDRASDKYWGMKQGADEYFFKPVDPDLLLRKV